MLSVLSVHITDRKGLFNLGLSSAILNTTTYTPRPVLSWHRPTAKTKPLSLKMAPAMTKNMHQVVAMSQQVKPPWEPPFRYLRGIQNTPREIDGRQAKERPQVHHLVKLLPPELEQPMYNRHKDPCAEEDAHQESTSRIARPDKWAS